MEDKKQGKKSLLDWFRSRKWNVEKRQWKCGVGLEMPVQEDASTVMCYHSDNTYIDEDDIEKYHKEYRVSYDYNPLYSKDTVEVEISHRKVYTSGPNHEIRTEPWDRNRPVHFSITVDELEKLTEIVKECRDTFDKVDEEKSGQRSSQGNA